MIDTAGCPDKVRPGVRVSVLRQLGRIAASSWRRLNRSPPAERIPAHGELLPVRGRAPGPSGAPAGLSAEAGVPCAAEASPAGGEAYPVPSPVAGPGAVPGGPPIGPLVVWLNGERIETVTAAHFQLLQNHGGRGSIKMTPGKWTVRYRSRVLAVYLVALNAGGDLAVSRSWGGDENRSQPPEPDSRAAADGQRAGGNALLMGIVKDEGMMRFPSITRQNGARPGGAFPGGPEYTLIDLTLA